MAHLVFDGSFEGFMTLVYECYHRRTTPRIISTEAPKTLFEDSIIDIQTDIQKCERVLTGLRKNLSDRHLKTVYHLFLYDKEEIFLDLFRYIVLGFKNVRLLEDPSIDTVRRVEDARKRMFRYLHKMEGFLRFEELEDGTMYAAAELEFDVLYFLGKHFARRLGNEKFIIHDRRRKRAFVYGSGEFQIYDVAAFKLPERSREEKKFARLWRVFFDSVSIESRRNDKVQRNMVPLLYRKYMTEFN